MQYEVVSGNTARIAADCLVITITGKTDSGPSGLHPELQALDAQSQGRLGEILARGDLPEKAGKTLMLHALPGVEAARILLVHAGKDATATETDALKAVRAAAAQLHGVKAGDVVYSWNGLETRNRDTAWLVEQTVLAISSAGYRFNAFKSDQEKPPSRGPQKVTFVTRADDAADLKTAASRAVAVSEGIKLARDLGNRPGNACTPTYLAETAQKLAASQQNIECKVLSEEQLEELGMGSFLSVTAGSKEPARLIVLEYHNGSPSQEPIALIGKGITFDTGGISLKPSAAMDEMKFDMCGAASVLGAFAALGTLQPRLDVVGIIAAAENMPGGNATKPGDIVTSMSGQTVEVLNTDAEGRLVLCDAMTYAIRQYNPRCIVDIATLTGACVVALGEVASGLFSNDDKLAGALQEAGTRMHDRAWRMPVWEDYNRQLDSNFADMANIGGPKAGSVTAACFLSRFTEKRPWAHLDIAGTAWKSGGASKGATGRPVPLLVQFLLDQTDPS